MHSSHALLLLTAAGLSIAQSTFSPLRPPALPIAVKSPYLSTYLQAGSDGGNGGYLAGEWPTFWQGQVTAWTGFIRVDNVTYAWMGNPDQNKVYANQTAYEYTSTRSIFTFNVGGYVELNATFLSTVTPNDLLRSSLPYSYLETTVSSIDGQEHDVQLYTDISAEWVSGDHGANAQWSYGTIAESNESNEPSSWKATATPYQSSTNSTGGIAYHQVYRQQQLNFSETNQQADWGYWYYATDNIAALTYQSGEDTTVRGNFLNNGYLPDTQDTKYRAINDDYPVFGFAVNLGQVGTTAQNTLFQLSLHQHYCVQFEGANGNETVPCMWTNYFDSDLAAVEYFYNDYSKGGEIATQLDQQIATDSIAAGGQDYLSITSLSVRQAFSALEYTNTPEDPYVFLKEISSDGNVQTVDVIFPFHPIAIYLNPSLLSWMLNPLFINQEAGYWPYMYSIHDLGTNFPNATGHNDGNDEQQPLEECGDMIIMTLAYAQRANDDAYLATHYDILKQWNEYLISEALIPANQISTDDFAGALANQTNLALKGIIGIEAMAQIANRTGHAEDGANYTKIAHEYIRLWQTYGIDYNATTPHAELNYGNTSSYVLLYNLFGDAELGLDLVPQSVYDMQSKFYPTVFNAYGVPLDTRHTYTKVDWEIFCASIASNSTKQQFTTVIARWLDQTPTNYAFTDLYDTITADYPSGITFIDRPVVGGTFAPLALNSAPSSGFVTPSGNSSAT
ncbi:GTA glutaminase A [Teratosphaeria nubilosa]|uniref:GTA glutaminase A n=1 Tax=Teratosphaeria nubilosa TaxID=161662 RepID=A0A6G1LBI7_9PEZI|nr:GTA glutaminase A [Teratosphaeria nubilosa]